MRDALHLVFVELVRLRKALLNLSLPTGDALKDLVTARFVEGIMRLNWRRTPNDIVILRSLLITLSQETHRLLLLEFYFLTLLTLRLFEWLEDLYLGVVLVTPRRRHYHVHITHLVYHFDYY